VESSYYRIFARPFKLTHAAASIVMTCEVFVLNLISPYASEMHNSAAFKKVLGVVQHPGPQFRGRQLLLPLIAETVGQDAAPLLAPS